MTDPDLRPFMAETEPPVRAMVDETLETMIIDRLYDSSIWKLILEPKKALFSWSPMIRSLHIDYRLTYLGVDNPCCSHCGHTKN